MQLPKHPSTVVAYLATILFAVVVDTTEALSPPEPECPKQCDIPNLQEITEKIIDEEAFLTDGSCEKSMIGIDDLSFTFQYTFTDPDEEAGAEELGNRRAQSLINERPPMTNMPPIDGFNQTIFGWSISADKETQLGTCFTAPNKIAGPFPLANLTSCIHDMNLACYRIKSELNWRECPCYDKKEVERIKRKLMLRIYDPDFQVDMNLSCKIPSQNNNFPYGLYTKPNGVIDDIYGSTLRVGLDIKVFDDLSDFPPFHKAMNQCYNKDQGKRSPLTFYQSTQCKSLMKDLCDFLEDTLGSPGLTSPQPSEAPKTAPVSSFCSDDVDFRLGGETWKSCEYLVGSGSGSRRVRNCRKYDFDTEKYVFQHCRKSCKRCTCRNNRDFTLDKDVPEHNCEWLSKLESTVRDEICHQNMQVSTNCIRACRSKCCKNNVWFSYWKEVKTDDAGGRKSKKSKKTRVRWVKKTCADVSNANWREECKLRKVAVNCPMICRKCTIQPRIGK